MRVGGLLIDLEGTLYKNSGPIQGAQETLKRLEYAGIPYRCITNITHKPRREVSAHLQEMGFPVGENRIFTPAVAAAERLRGVGCYPLVEDSLLEDLEGLRITEDSPECVLVGNLGEGFTYGRLNAAFRHLMAGAELVALLRNPYWRTAEGEPSLDAGPFVAALEYASGKPAVGIGKPERAVFELALKDLDLPPRTVAMVGDDPEADVGGARTAGLSGILVRTGKGSQADSMGEAELVLESVAQLPAALGIEYDSGVYGC